MNQPPRTWDVAARLGAASLGPLHWLVLALTLWSNVAYDRLMITKVRADLAVAQTATPSPVAALAHRLGTTSIAKRGERATDVDRAQEELERNEVGQHA